MPRLGGVSAGAELHEFRGLLAPSARGPGFHRAEYYRRIGRALEAGKFHLGFFDDRLAMPDLFGGDHAHTVANGIRCVKMDPITILTVMGMATEQLGLGSTFSTTYFEPFHVARVFATLDLMTKGRAAWNVVTSMNDGEAHNMGHAAHGDHDARYDRADEFMEVVMGHWDAWEDDAIVADRDHRIVRASRQSASPGLQGKLLPVARSVHRASLRARPSGHHPGRPVRSRHHLRRALGRVRVRRLSRHRAGATRLRRRLKARSQAAGRDPEQVHVCAGVYPVVAETRAEAEDKVALIDKLPKEIDSLSLLSEVLNFDFSRQPIDKPFTQEQLDSWTGVRGIHDRMKRELGDRLPSPRDFINITQRGTFHDHPRFVGSPKDVADGLEEWFVSRACDGFVVAASHVPGAYEEFSRFVVPELQRRGLHHLDYKGATLRENLGLDRPAVGDWRKYTN